MHRITLSDSDKKLPESVMYYNKTKAGVDAVDQMARMYSVRAGTRRWPVHVFYNILDLAAINAWVIYKECTEKKMARHEFILSLSLELSERMRLSRARATLDPAHDVPAECKLDGRVRCQIKDMCRGNKCNLLCANCRKPTCGPCTSASHIVCRSCKPVDA